MFSILSLVSYEMSLKEGERFEANEQNQSRMFDYCYDDDGMLVFRGRLRGKDGAVLMKAMQVLMDRRDVFKNVPAGTPTGMSAVRLQGCNRSKTSGTSFPERRMEPKPTFLEIEQQHEALGLTS